MSIYTNYTDFGAMNIISETKEAASASECLKWSLLISILLAMLLQYSNSEMR